MMNTMNGTNYPQPPAGAPMAYPAQPTAAPQTPSYPAAAYNAPAAVPVAPQVQYPATTQAPMITCAPMATPAAASTNSEPAERWVGGTILSVLAALLVLGGIVLLTEFLLPENPVVGFAIAALYCVAVCVLGVVLALKSSVQESTQRIKALVALATSEFMLLIVTAESAWRYSGEVSFLLFMIILLVLRFAPLPQALSSNTVILRINELAVLFFAALYFFAFGIAGGAKDAIAPLVLLGLFTVGAGVLVGSRALDLANPAIERPASAFPVLSAAAFMGVLLGYVIDVAQVSSSPYVWSALCLICALVCVGAGFWFREKPLRIYGLTVALLCVAKIVLIDVSGDMLVRAIALVLGGLACFGISMLYMFAAKRLDS